MEKLKTHRVVKILKIENQDNNHRVGNLKRSSCVLALLIQLDARCAAANTHTLKQDINNNRLDSTCEIAGKKLTN